MRQVPLRRGHASAVPDVPAHNQRGGRSQPSPTFELLSADHNHNHMVVCLQASRPARGGPLQALPKAETSSQCSAAPRQRESVAPEDSP